MRILGIDPGLRVTGFGVIDKTGHTLTYVTSGIIKTADADLPSRLNTIFEGISTLVRQHSPDQSAIEKVFVNVNPQSTLLLGQARGAAICGLVASGVPVAEYTALQLKQAVVGLWPRDERTNAADGRAPAQLSRASPAPTPPTPSAWRSAMRTAAARWRRSAASRHRSRKKACASGAGVLSANYTCKAHHDRSHRRRSAGKKSAASARRLQWRRIRNRRADEHVLQPAAYRRKGRVAHAIDRPRRCASALRLRHGSRNARLSANCSRSAGSVRGWRSPCSPA